MVLRTIGLPVVVLIARAVPAIILNTRGLPVVHIVVLIASVPAVIVVVPVAFLALVIIIVPIARAYVSCCGPSIGCGFAIAAIVVITSPGIVTSTAPATSGTTVLNGAGSPAVIFIVVAVVLIARITPPIVAGSTLIR
jgi:hypothetical protein